LIPAQFAEKTYEWPLYHQLERAQPFVYTPSQGWGPRNPKLEFPDVRLNFFTGDAAGVLRKKAKDN